mmetsp:Transcript_6854/g.6156  ORF Transcript_6854/g.6156 Transcript_6854/m.6156 type:complete len:217 (-) Transcript_6854:98-748(-)
MTLTFYYLNLRARGEIPRFILKYGKIDYKDVTIPIKNWPQYKYDANICHFGALPSITIGNGKVISQSGAIARYCAKLAGIYPNDPIEAAEADMVFELAQELNDINPILNAVPYESDAYRTKYDNYFKILPGKLDAVSKILGNKKFFGGEGSHHGDFALFHILDNVQTVVPGYLKDYPSLLNWDREIRSLPAIKSYLDSRPPTGPLLGREGSLIQRI